MEMTLEQRAKFEEASKPLIQWLNENCNPHASVIVTPDAAELVYSEAVFICEDFLED